MAERLGRGLQNLVQRFESARNLKTDPYSIVHQYFKGLFFLLYLNIFNFRTNLLIFNLKNAETNMKNLTFLASLNWWILLEQSKTNSARFHYEAFKTTHNCFPLLKGNKKKNHPISVQQKSVGITQQQIQLLDNEISQLIEDL